MLFVFTQRLMNHTVINFGDNHANNIYNLQIMYSYVCDNLEVRV